MDMDALIHWLLQKDWHWTCHRDSFCFVCWLSFCRHYCPHWSKHHPGADPARDRVGFDWTLNIRTKRSGWQWICLNPRLVQGVDSVALPAKWLWCSCWVSCTFSCFLLDLFLVFVVFPFVDPNNMTLVSSTSFHLGFFVGYVENLMVVL